MEIVTERLTIRDFILNDAKALHNLKYDELILEYNPTFIKRDAKLSDSFKIIEYFQSVKDKGDFSREIYYAITSNEDNNIIGAITVSQLEYLWETQMGWMIGGKHRGCGFASEAGKAVSDYLLETFSYEYIVAVMDIDNPASYRTAQKSGFKLFEKRFPYDYHYSNCNVENYAEVGRHFEEKQKQIGTCYYYFRKYNKNTGRVHLFYGDTEYDGRFS